MLWQPPLPDRYAALTDDAVAAAITRRRDQLADAVVILGHHYQRDDVIAHADYTGDSFKLSQLAADTVDRAGARHVVFCGVHFMAESADILTPEPVTVSLPDLSAGCSMADMAADDDVEDAWAQITAVLDDANFVGRVVPITYMNSSAAIKAFVGDRGGAVCTSSNARAVLEWAFAGGASDVRAGSSTSPAGAEDGPARSAGRVKLLFLPDQHLGRNTAKAMGYEPETQMCLWDPQAPDGLGGNTPDDIVRSDVILWKGHCSVHKLFRPEHVDQARAQHPGTTVIVHPECDRAVVDKADQSGSTEAIIRAIDAAEPGSRWAVGTEVHLVNRLAKRAAGRGVHVRILSECQCLCTTMYRITPRHLLWTLDNLAEGNVVNRVTVDEDIRRSSLVALERMLRITGKAPAGAGATVD